VTIDSQIVLRFATTVISSSMENQGTEAGWAVFRQKIPLLAFITDFHFILDGKTYQGVVNEKSQNDTRLRGRLEFSQGGGFITELNPESKVFVISVNLNPSSTVEFSIEYQILLPRRQGIYKHHVSLTPGQLVDNLSVDVSITEPQGVHGVKAYLLDRSKAGAHTQYTQVVTKISESKHQVSYHPTDQEQQQHGQRGILADFVVEYDVNHASDAGDIRVLNDYFVQFFSPTGLPVLRKHVIFVIDISSSMEGTKLAQVKAALKTILEEISPGDKFNILPFSNQVEFLDRYRMVEASFDNVQYAKTYVDELQVMDGRKNLPTCGI
jgi:hypothetical protein